MNNVAIIDYFAGNVGSVARAIKHCGAVATITGSKAAIEDADRIVLPGVGSFHEGMQSLRSLGLDAVLRDQVLVHRKPLLGICLGMQLLASQGVEGGVCAGLDLIPGEVRRLEPGSETERIPHVGWNDIEPIRDSVLTSGIPGHANFYFVHSYHLVCSEPSDVLAVTPYCGSFVSAVARDCVLGVQFHPEKSMKAGLQLIRNFLSM